MVHETRSRAHAAAQEEGKSRISKKAKHGSSEAADEPGKEEMKAAASKDFAEFCKAARAHLSVNEMRRILEANGQDSSGSDDAVVPRCEDMMFYGPLEKCPVCGGQLDCSGKGYRCTGAYSDWTSCAYTTRSPARRREPARLPDDVKVDAIKEWLEKQQSRGFPERELSPEDQIFAGYTVALSGRLSRTHRYWKKQISKHGGRVNNSVIGVNCVVASPNERERGGSTGISDAIERNTPIVGEKWLIDSIENQEVQPIAAYDIVSDLIPEGGGIPLSKLEPGEEAIETIAAELKLHGKRGVYKDSLLEKEGGKIFEKDGIIYNCALSLCDPVHGFNDYVIMQLIMVPKGQLHLYYKKGKIGHGQASEERVENFENRVGDVVKEFVRLFEELTGDKFEPWERHKEFEKKPKKFFPLDMDDGVDVRAGALGLRQLGAAAAHSKLDPAVCYLVKILCSQEIYRYALMEIGHDIPDLPLGMLSEAHMRRGEELLRESRERLASEPENAAQAELLWIDFSNRWFTLFPSTRPCTIEDFHELADNVAAAFETIRDINAASRLIGDVSGATLDDPLSDCYRKMNCSITQVDTSSDDYKMIVKYLETTYEPVQVEDVKYSAVVERIYEVEAAAGPSYDEIKKLPNKHLLWCGSRSSNMLRHLVKGFLPAVCQIPAPGYMFGKAVVCSDTAAEAARYGFTAVDRPEGILVLAVASLGDKITEIAEIPESTKELEEKGMGVKGLGRKKTNESEHMTWRDDVKVPCGKLVPSEHKDSPLEYNEYAVYNPKQACIKFLVMVKYEEQNMEVVETE